MYTIEIYGEKKSETTGKMRNTRAGTVTSMGETLTAALDDLKAVIAKLDNKKQAKIVKVIILPMSEQSDEPKINL